MAASRKPRLILVDDHRMVLESFQASLSVDYDVVGVASDGIELLGLLQHVDADCLLLDLQLPGRNGLELISPIRHLRPRLKIIVVTIAADRILADAAVNAGADGFVPKDAPLSELRAAIAEVTSNRIFISPRVPKSSHRMGFDADHVYLNRLTPRQQQFVLLIGEGKRQGEIASELHLSASTMTFHKKNVMRLLGITTDGAFTRYCVLVRAVIADSQA